MTSRRVSVQDYPEHLNPFYENYNGGGEITNRSKYNTWSLPGKYKIKHTLDKSWAAIHSSPGKSKLGRKLSFLKAVTVDKLHLHSSKKKAPPALTTVSHSSSSSVNAMGSISATSTPAPTRYYEPFIIMSPKQKEKLRQQRLAAEAAAAAAEAEAGASSKETDTIQQNGVDITPSHSKQYTNHVGATEHTSTLVMTPQIAVNGSSSQHKTSDMDSSSSSSSSAAVPTTNHVAEELPLPKSGVNSAVSTPLLERSYDSQGVRPKMRKKRAAPRPPQEENKPAAVESEKGSPSVEPESSDDSTNRTLPAVHDVHHTHQQERFEINGSRHHNCIQISTAHVVLSSRKSCESGTAAATVVNQADEKVEEESKEKEINSNNDNRTTTNDNDDNTHTETEDEINNNQENKTLPVEKTDNNVSEEVAGAVSSLEKETTAEREQQLSEQPSSPSETVKTDVDKQQQVDSA